MQRIIQLFAVFVILIITSQHSYAFNPKEGHKEGILILKSGIVLKGKILPLPNFHESGTSFKNDNGQETIIAHHQIEKISIGNRTFIPKMIEIDEKTIPTYAEIIVQDNASLWKIYYNIEKVLGKNHKGIKFETGWLIKSPLKGSIVLNIHPTSKQVAKALEHPMFAIKKHHHQFVDEVALRNLLDLYNTSLAKLESELNDNNR